MKLGRWTGAIFIEPLHTKLDNIARHTVPLSCVNGALRLAKIGYQPNCHEMYNFIASGRFTAKFCLAEKCAYFLKAYGFYNIICINAYA